MKKVLFFIAFAFVGVCNAQMIGLKLTDKSNANILCVQRGLDCYCPVYDNNADLFLPVDILTDPKFSDLTCLVDSLTEPYTALPLTEVLRFASSEHRTTFINFVDDYSPVLLNNVNDIILTPSVWDVLYTYPDLLQQTLIQATIVDRFEELLLAELIIPIPFPQGNTPIDENCN